MLHATPHSMHRRVVRARTSTPKDDTPCLGSPRAGRTSAAHHTSRRMRKFKHFFAKPSHPQWRHKLGERVKTDGAGPKLTHSKAHHSHVHASSSVRAYPATVIASSPPQHMNASRFKKFVQHKLEALRSRHPHRDRGEITMLPLPTTQPMRPAAVPPSSSTAVITPARMAPAVDVADRTTDDAATLMAAWDGLDRVAPAECGYELRLTDCADDVPDTLQEYLGLLDPTYHGAAGGQDSHEDVSSSYSSSFSLTPPSPELQLLRDGVVVMGGNDTHSNRHGCDTAAPRSPPPQPAPSLSSTVEGGDGGRVECASFAAHISTKADPYLLLLRQRAVIEKYLLMLWILTDYLRESYQQEQRNRACYAALHNGHAEPQVDTVDGAAGGMAYAGYVRRLARSRARRAQTLQCAKETVTFWLRRINLSYAFEDVFADATRLLDAMSIFGVSSPSSSLLEDGDSARQCGTRGQSQAAVMAAAAAVAARRRFLGSGQVLEAEQVHVQQLSSRLRRCWDTHLRLRQDMIEFEALQPRNAAEVLRLSGLTRERFRRLTTPFRQCCRETMTDPAVSNDSSDADEPPSNGAVDLVATHTVGEPVDDGGDVAPSTGADSGGSGATTMAMLGAAGVLKIEVLRSQSDTLEKGERSGPFTYDSGEATSRGTPASALRREEPGVGRTARHVTFALDSPSSVESEPCGGQHQRLHHLSPAPLALCAAASGLPGAQKLVKDHLERMEEVFDYFTDVCAMKERQLAEVRHEFAQRQTAGGGVKSSDATRAPRYSGATGHDGGADPRQRPACDLSRESSVGESRMHSKGLRHGKGNMLSKEKNRSEERRPHRSPKQTYASSCFVV